MILVFLRQLREYNTTIQIVQHIINKMGRAVEGVVNALHKSGEIEQTVKTHISQINPSSVFMVVFQNLKGHHA